MKRINKLTDHRLETSRSNVIGEDRKMPKPTERNMRKMVDRINELTEMVNILAERQGLIEPEKEENEWG